MKAFLLPLIAALFLASCASPEKLTNSGQFDRAIEVSLKRLKGRKKNPKFVMSLERAFLKATERDMRSAENLKREGNPENWGRIYALYQLQKNRQNRISPYLPLVADNGYRPDFNFIDVSEFESESKRKAAEFLYADGLRQLEMARASQDRMTARNAYSQFQAIQQYYSTYKDRETLMAEARQLGTTQVGVIMVNNAPVVMPEQAEREMLRLDAAGLNDAWTNYTVDPQSVTGLDYVVVMNIKEIAISPQNQRERQYTDTKEIQDGFEYVLDRNGNVMKDSLGRDMKIPKMINVRANVVEIYQHKAARVGGMLEFRKVDGNQLIKAIPLAVDAVFENYAATFMGDRRALSPESSKRIGNAPLPFPADPAMLFQAAEMMKPTVKQHILDYRGLLP
jgi:hypothetical protein